MLIHLTCIYIWIQYTTVWLHFGLPFQLPSLRLSSFRWASVRMRWDVSASCGDVKPNEKTMGTHWTHVSRFLSFLGVMNPDFWGCKTVKPLCWMIFGVVVSNPTWNIGASFVHNKHPKKNRWDHQVQKVDPRDLNLHLHIRIHHWPPTAPPGSTNTIARSLLSNTWQLGCETAAPNKNGSDSTGVVFTKFLGTKP